MFKIYLIGKKEKEAGIEFAVLDSGLGQHWQGSVRGGGKTDNVYVQGLVR